MQQLLDHLHHGRGALHGAIVGLIRGREIFAEIDAAGLDDGEQFLERDDLLVHGVAAVVDDDVETAARGVDERVEERFVFLRAGEDFDVRYVGAPVLDAFFVVLDVVLGHICQRATKAADFTIWKHTMSTLGKYSSHV